MTGKSGQTGIETTAGVTLADGYVTAAASLMAAMEARSALVKAMMESARSPLIDALQLGYDGPQSLAHRWRDVGAASRMILQVGSATRSIQASVASSSLSKGQLFAGLAGSTSWITPASALASVDVDTGIDHFARRQLANARQHAGQTSPARRTPAITTGPRTADLAIPGLISDDGTDLRSVAEDLWLPPRLEHPPAVIASSPLLLDLDPDLGRQQHQPDATERRRAQAAASLYVGALYMALRVSGRLETGDLQVLQYLIDAFGIGVVPMMWQAAGRLYDRRHPPQ